MVLAYYVHNLSPFIIRFTDHFGIRYYGLAYVLGFIGAAWLLGRYYRAGRSQLQGDRVADLIFYAVLGTMIGGRLGYFLLYQPDSLWHDPLVLLQVWDGGMASHGGFVGVTTALWLFARNSKIRFTHLGDLVVSTVPLGLMLGRLANFINGELWGKPADVPWAVIFSNTEGGPFPRHPSQLYEAALEGALLLAYLQWRLWRTDIVRQRPGRLSGEFLLGYALVRIFCEQFREPDRDISLIAGLSRGQFYSLFLILAGVGLILWTRRSRPLEIARPSTPDPASSKDADGKEQRSAGQGSAP